MSTRHRRQVVQVWLVIGAMFAAGVALLILAVVLAMAWF